MANYPGSETERRLTEHDLQRGVQAIFEACGLTAADAHLLTESLVQADLRGIHSHGVMRVPNYVLRLTQGGVDPKGQPAVVKDAGAVLVVDGGNSMGQIGGAFAMHAAIERAYDTGIAFAALGRSNHCGALDHYARMAIAADMIGIVGTNALPTMAPWGGIDKLVGLNPIGVGIPAGEELPFVLDVALGATAHGKMQIYEQKGAPIPEGWAFDAEGRPTTDVAQALAGLVQPIGGHKGIGLATAIGILSTLLSGAGYGRESGNMIDGPVAGRDGQFYLALNVGAFEDVATFKARMDALIRDYKATRLAPGFERVYVPGELEVGLERARRSDGIPLNEETIAGLVRSARDLGVDASPFEGA
jgi:LDH2 family malate/lactate/ureidoglycolate dehydrogenase